FAPELVRIAEDDHVLVLRMHHVVGDEWSVELMWQELGALYQGRALTPLAVQYADFAAWQRSWVAGDVLAQQLNYWRARLAGAEPLEIPTDRPRPAELGVDGVIVERTLPLTLGRAVEAVGRAQGATPFMPYLAALYALLHRYSQQEDISIGTPVANRGRAETDGLIGYFLNTVVLRADLGGSPSVGALLGHVRDVALGAYAHQDAPFEHVVEALRVPRNAGRSPLFQVMFVHQRAGETSDASDASWISGITKEDVELDVRPTAKFELTLRVIEHANRVSCVLEANAALFDATTLERMLAHYERLLAAMAAEPGRAIDAVSLLTEGEQAQLARWNATAQDYARDLCVHELFEDQVHRTPDSVAVVCEGEQRTYRQLDDQASRLAHRLVALGVGADDVVAIYLERSVEVVVVLLAVLKAGGAYLPLDPDLPVERLQYMARDARAKVVVTRDTVLEGPWATLRLDEAQDAGPTAPLRGRARPHNLVYVLYTSGSTGQPKGVQVEHRNLTNYVAGVVERFGLTPGTSYATVTTFAADLGNTAVFPALCGGGTLHIITRDRVTSPARLGAYLAQHRVDVLKAVPSLVLALLDSEDPASVLPRRLLVSGGEPLPWTLVDRVRALAPACTVVNHYGPTETTVGSLTNTTDGVRVGPVVPIGYPLLNQTAYVLDPARGLCPIGVVGELYIGGAGVTRGYGGRPELTAERFIANPFGEGRLYRTGDRVRRQRDGAIEFLGRVDTQVKIRGYRVELGEIEAVLAAHGAVRDVVVTVREDQPGDKRLVAYVVGREATVKVDALRAHVAATLPDYMVPSAFVVLEAMPLTLNGKLDRKALPAPDFGALAQRAYVAPLTETEQLLAGIWCQLLRVERVGVHDDFFELGGHSLLAMRLVARVRQVLAVELTLRAVFEAPRLGALAEVIARSSGERVPPLVPVARGGELEASFGQQRFWVLAQMAERDAYNSSKVVRLVGELDETTLARAVDALVARHEVLRTTLAERDGTVVQRIAPARAGVLAVVEVESYEAALTYAREVAELPFDLTTGPLFAPVLVRISAADHVFVLRMHHAAGDEWSMGVLYRELFALYEGRELAPLVVQYADVSAWQRSWMVGEVLERQLEYWREQLRGGVPLELPTDRPRAAGLENRGAMVTRAMPAELGRAMAALGRAHGATPFMTWLAAFYVLLYRHSRQGDLSVGTPVANRGSAETDALVGYFLNTVVLRADVSSNPSFVELLAQVRTVALGAYAHQDAPFERVVEAVREPRDPVRSPLFQVMFVHQRADERSVVPGLAVEDVELGGTGTSKFELTLFINEGPHDVTCAMELNTELFDVATIERMLGHFHTLAEGIVEEPARKIGELALLTAAERQQLLVEWNATARADYSDDTCLHELFEQQVDRTPDAIAVVADATALTYRQLDERANQLAFHLRSCGVGPGELVGIFLERSVEIVVALLGALKSGAAYVPLDPAYPEDRITSIYEQARPQVLITQSALGDRLPVLGARIVRVDSDAAEIARRPSSRLSRTATRTDLSHVIFTSGSTGRPKGVAIEHGVMVNYSRFARDLHPRPELGAWLFATSVCFDMSLFEVFVPLSWGARIYVVEDLLALPSVPDDAGLTFVNAVPSVMSAFLQAGALPATLQAVSCAGEPLSNALVQQLRAAGVACVYDFYGPTETFIVTWSRRSGEGPAVIGRPIANTQIYVLDAHGGLVPVGVPGDLYVAGEGLARGYFNEPAMTSERFVPNPFGAGRLYKTGDLARWLPDGTLQYVGRSDHQVKIRGFRIELGEIEVVLGAHASVREVVVLAREDEPGDKRLVAYVVGRGGKPEVDELRMQAAAALPEYMVPSAFVVLDAMPLTPNGKVDRKALPAPDLSASSQRTYVAPRTEAEELLAGIWIQLLGIERVGVHDNFFELGGHSLLVMRLVARVRQVHGVELTVRAVFEARTLGNLAAVIARSTAASAPALVPVAREGALPASFGQQRFWVLAQLDERDSYDLSHPVRLAGPVDVAELRRAMDGLVARHEVLRTTFAEVDGVVVQRITPPRGGALAVVNVGSYDEARAYCVEVVRQPYDLTAGPLFAPVLLRISDEDHVLLLRMHHIVADEWSFEVLWRELAALYQGQELAPLRVQYADYAAWQRGWLVGDVVEQQLAYWRAQLTGLEPLELPTDRPRPVVRGTHGAVARVTLPAELGSRVEALGRAAGATPFMAYLAAFYVLLYRYSHQADLAVGAPVAQRGRADTDELIGYFLNTVVLRADLSTNPRFVDLLTHVRDVALGAYAHQDLPFERVVEALRVSRDLSRTPLFQVMFVCGRAGGMPGLAGLPMEPVALPEEVSSFDLTLFVDMHPEGLGCRLEYNTDLFDRETIERMLGHYCQLLEGIVADATQPIGGLPILTADERQQLLVEWNATARDYPRDRCLHELVEAQVERTPDAIAVVLDGAQVTYRELDARANQLAHHLIGLGAGPEVKVGVFVERSLEMVVGILGILKAGAAYVPLETKAPADRLAFIVGDASATLVITQAHLVQHLGAVSTQLVRLDADAALIARSSTRRPETEVRPEHLAYVIYTSGSTGRPKGVQIEHRQIVNLVMGSGAVEGIEATDRVLQFSSIAFDSSVEELFTPLSHGATMVLRGEEVPTALELFGERYKGVTVMNMATAYWHAIAMALRDHQLTPPAELRMINIGGERALPEYVRRWHELLPGCELNNQYGPTETTVMATAWRLDRDQLLDGREVPIGRPLPNYTVYVRDARGELVPVGVDGELYIGGESVARGYLDRPELTAEKFVANPFGLGRLYRTGDLVRWRADGNLEFVGRADDQVKIRGFRIELGEIEAVFAEHPAVQNVAVVARAGEGGEKHLVAYVVLGAAAPASELGGYVRSRLPAYMVPARLVVVDGIPISPTGKVNKTALPDVPGEALAEPRMYEAPEGEHEQTLAGIWCELLGLDQVGRHDDFFELGGHSLLVMQLVARVRQVLMVELTMRAVFETPTLGALAEVIGGATGEVAPPLVPVARGGDLAASFGQQRFWVLAQIAEHDAYQMSDVFRLVGDLDEAALARAMDTVVARHEVLRTTLAEVDGTVVQRIAPAQAGVLTVVEVGSYEAAQAYSRELVERPFDLAKGPLFAPVLLRISAADHVLVLRMHHVVGDEWSTPVLYRDLFALYEGRELTPLVVQYADVAAWQRSWLVGDVLERQLAYWREQLRGGVPLELPADRPRPAVLGNRGATVARALPAELGRAMAALGRAHGTTPFMTWLAAFYVLLHRYSRQSDLSVGTPVANRGRAETDALVGYFLNTLVLRADVSSNSSFVELLAQVRTLALGAYAHQDAPFERVVEAVREPRDPARSPLFQVMFVHQQAGESSALPGLAVEDVDLGGNDTAKFELTLFVNEAPNDVMCAIELNTELFEPSTIERMLRHFETLLAGIVADPARRIGELPLLTAAERQQMLVEWNATSRDYPQDACVH
ncbi:MAG: amino acid adenylation domain-containing protein, partial [Kofleriaceae bacterium]|nr:amino acid adenylation domain-containing protein [Kofleriaceae bacterium]